MTCADVSGFGRTRSSSRLSRSKNISVSGSIRIPTWRPARISAATRTMPPRAMVPPRDTTRSASTAAPCSTGGSGEGPAFTAQSAANLLMSFTVRCDRTLLILVPLTDRWIRSTLLASPADLLRYRRRTASHAVARYPPTRESSSTNGLPGTDHAHLAASFQRFMGGHNLTELRTDLAHVILLLDHDDDEGLFGTDALS